MRILAIETSCDETGVAVLEAKGNVKHSVFNILSNVVASQAKIHAKWGGVVPNLAKREHQRNLLPILKQALKESRLLKSQNPKTKSQNYNSKLKIIKSILEREPELAEKLIPFLEKRQTPKIDLIAVTQGPGLEPALWVGINFAKALAMVWDKPIIGINHLEGHIFSVFLKNPKNNLKFKIENLKFPAIALLVSGGHTQLILIRDWLKYKILGETLDDAAGEAFDKVARLLKLGYPGGPAIAAAAAKSACTRPVLARPARTGLAQIKLPRPMLNSKDYNFSFSGLKTAVLYLAKDLKEMAANSHDRENLLPSMVSAITAEFQQAVIDCLLKKTIRAAKEYKAKTIILGGGVAANKKFRQQLDKSVANIRSSGYLRRLPIPDLLMPEMEFTGDNAAMIALAAYFRALKIPHTAGRAKKIGDGSKIAADSNLKLK